MNKEQLEKLPVSRDVLHWLAQQLSWRADEMERAFEDAEIYPSASHSRLWLDRALLATSLVLIICGVIFFFAYNWADMHKFAKMGLVGFLLVVAGAVTVYQSPDSFAFKMGLTALVGLTGTFFALFGQIYQTGANAYDFFWGWTMVATVWVAISRFPPLWLFYLVLVNTTLLLYISQVRLWSLEAGAFLLVACICLAAWMLWEWMHYRGSALFEARWWPRTVALAAYYFLFMLSMQAIFDSYDLVQGIETAGLLLFLATTAGILFVYRLKIKDIAMLAIAMLGGIAFANALAVKLMADSWRNDDALILMFFLCGTMTVVATYMGVQYLIKLHKQWTIEEISRN